MYNGLIVVMYALQPVKPGDGVSEPQRYPQLHSRATGVQPRVLSPTTVDRLASTTALLGVYMRTRQSSCERAVQPRLGQQARDQPNDGGRRLFDIY